MVENNTNQPPQTNDIQIITEANITCPECGNIFKAVMPLEGKQHFFKCPEETCGADISTKEDECCIFCTYSDQVCPAKQLNPDEDKKESTLQSLI